MARVSRLRPTLAMVLGSGFGGAAARVQVVEEISYRSLPGFPEPSVRGHTGKVLLGVLGGTEVCLFSGRVHYYEGHPMERVTFPIRVLAEFGVRTVVLTNAAGGINRRYRPGDFMALADHLNLMGANPLRGPALEGRERFVDLTCVYDPKLRQLVRRAARNAAVKLHAGVYAAVSGPTYETPAEVRALGRLGVDAVGMSTVPEAIVARQCGLAVAGLSCITNRAAGKSNAFLSHADVLALGARMEHRAAALLEEVARLYAARD